MLKNIHIKNFAVIADTSIDFNSALNIITGQTGSGKSLIIESIRFLLGSKLPKESIRTGENTMSVDGTIFVNSKNIHIRRTLSSNGKTSTYINNSKSTILELHSIVSSFYNYFGQEQQHELRSKDMHIEYLDRYGDYNTDLDNFNTLFSDHADLKEQIIAMRNDLENYNTNRELYMFQISEIDAMKVDPKTEDRLHKEHQLLSNYSKIKERIELIKASLGNDTDSAISRVSSSKRLLGDILETSKEIEDVYSRLDSIGIDLEDIYSELGSFIAKSNIDDKKLNDITEHIEHIETVKRKFGGTVPAVLEYKDKITNLLSNGESIEKALKKLIDTFKQKDVELLDAANILSKKRKEASVCFENEIISNLINLDIPDIRFKVFFTDNEEGRMTKYGIDSCEFLISANSGEEIRSLTEVASGGEISRIMLAIKMTMQDVDPANIIIFDEIDSGISGSTASKVGQSIKNIASNYQVVCVTHLPQIARHATSHFSVLKSTHKGRTFSSAHRLTKNEIDNELIILMAGSDQSVLLKQISGNSDG